MEKDNKIKVLNNDELEKVAGGDRVITPYIVWYICPDCGEEISAATESYEELQRLINETRECFMCGGRAKFSRYEQLPPFPDF